MAGFPPVNPVFERLIACVYNRRQGSLVTAMAAQIAHAKPDDSAAPTGAIGLMRTYHTTKAGEELRLANGNLVL